MQVESREKPNKSKIEISENRKMTVYFFDNIVEQEVTRMNEQQIIYVYDMYQITIENRPNLEEDIQNNFDIWLQFAKDCEYEKLAAEIRNKRDNLLTQTDWTQVTDTVLNTEKQQEYKEYRQQLRDIPEQQEFPYHVVFPEKPEESEE
ncbi:MAG: hypothetical protein HFJ17_01965 [Clostridia bacterium]|nr:hypothetical protein [Clostridia bacterium]